MSARSGRYISIRNRAVPFGRHLYEAYEHILCNRRLSLTTRPCAGKTMRFITKRDSVKEMSRAGPKKGAQSQPCQPRSFQGMSEKEEKFKQNQVQ